MGFCFLRLCKTDGQVLLNKQNVLLLLLVRCTVDTSAVCSVVEVLRLAAAAVTAIQVMTLGIDTAWTAGRMRTTFIHVCMSIIRQRRHILTSVQ